MRLRTISRRTKSLGVIAYHLFFSFECKAYRSELGDRTKTLDLSNKTVSIPKIRATDKLENVVETVPTNDGRHISVIKREITCRIWRVEILNQDNEEGYWVCEIMNSTILNAIGTRSSDFQILGSEVDDFLSHNKNKRRITSLTLFPGVEFISGTQTLRVRPAQIANIKFGSKENEARRGRRNLVNSVGDLKTLVVRVNANDASPPSAKKLSDDIFEDNFSLKSQYARCSYDKLNIYAATDLSVPSFSEGVIEVQVDLNAYGESRILLQSVANDAVTNLFGLARHDQLEDMFDLVLYVMPSGSTPQGWLAYAYIGRFDSYYNGDWSMSVSVLMHEIGHNMFLHHSGVTDGSPVQQEYGDQMGMMGFSYNEDDAPEQCFNPVKNWELGWYSDKSLDLNARLELQNGPKKFILNGVVDYDNTSLGKYVIIKIGNHYVGYNKKAEFNIGTVEAQDAVTVHEKLGLPYQASLKSKRLAVLHLNESYSIEKENIRIKYICNNHSEDAIVELSLLVPDNNPCNAEIEVLLKTDLFPSETHWRLKDSDGTILYNMDGYSQKLRTHKEKVFGLCSEQQYTFVIEDRAKGEYSSATITSGVLSQLDLDVSSESLLVILIHKDGICCDYGEGEVEGRSGESILFSQFNFTSSIWEAKFSVPPFSNSPTSFPPALDPTRCLADMPPTFEPTSSPSSTSSIVCSDERGKFLVFLNKKDRKRSCRWLAKRKPRRRTKLCKKPAQKLSDNIQDRMIQEICKNTCNNCLK